MSFIGCKSNGIYVLSVNEGFKEYKKVKVKRYADGSKEKQESVFRKGLDEMMKVVGTIETFTKYLIQKIQLRKQKKYYHKNKCRVG